MSDMPERVHVYKNSFDCLDASASEVPGASTEYIRMDKYREEKKSVVTLFIANEDYRVRIEQLEAELEMFRYERDAAKSASTDLTTDSIGVDE